jgi:hypothetical protein
MNEGRDILDVYKKIDENIPDQYQELKNALNVYIKNFGSYYLNIGLNPLNI